MQEDMALTKEEKEQLFADLVAHLERRDLVFTLDGPMMMTVKLKDNTFRKYSLGKIDCFLGEVYVGSRDVIFVMEFDELTPEVENYQHIEVNTKDMDTAFPFFLEEMKNWARERFCPRDESRLKELEPIDTVRKLIQTVIQYEKVDAKHVAKETEVELTSLPTFGMF